MDKCSWDWEELKPPLTGSIRQKKTGPTVEVELIGECHGLLLSANGKINRSLVAP